MAYSPSQAINAQKYFRGESVGLGFCIQGLLPNQKQQTLSDFPNVMEI